MADFVAILRKTIDGLKDNTPEMRQKVYEKARSTIEAKLAAAAPSEQAAERQRKLLEDAIGEVEAGYAAPVQSKDEQDDELDRIFSEFEPHPKPMPFTGVPSDDSNGADGDSEARDTREAVYGPETDDPSPADGQAAGEGGAAGDTAAADGEQGEPVLPGAPPKRRKRRTGLVVGLIILLILAGGGYAAWLYRDDLTRRIAEIGWLADLIGGEENRSADAGGEAPQDADQTGGDQAQSAGAGQDATSEDAAATDETPQKFTQRLTPEGTEVDEGPAAGEASELGEGTSVASSTQPGSAATTPAPSDAQGASDALPVGQKAIFYEERTNVSQGSAEAGAVVWSTVQESPGNDLPPEPAIRGEVTIPGKDLRLRMTIRRNADQSLPASHVVELIFLTPEGFEGGAIESVLRMAMKSSEQETGNPLLGIPAKIADGFFLVALSDTKAETETNELLLRRQSWIDIPIVYKSGRRALITMEKGVPGEEIFNDALQAWQGTSSG